MAIQKLIVRLNGTGTNPWHKLGLTQNPFPQIARYEYDVGEMAINSLGGDPLMGPEDIHRRLEGKVSDELIELCVSQFKPGELVEFMVTFKDGQD